jgi:hypothetical protein
LDDAGRFALTEKALLARLQQRWPTEHGYSPDFTRQSLEQLQKDGVIHCGISGRWSRYIRRGSASASSPEKAQPAAPPAPDEEAPDPVQSKGDESMATAKESKVKTCTACGEDKPIGDFYAGHGKCKPCFSQHQKDLKAKKQGGAAKVAAPAKPAKVKTAKAVAKSIANLRARANGPLSGNGNGSTGALLTRQYILNVDDVQGEHHILTVTQETVNRLASELREHS